MLDHVQPVDKTIRVPSGSKMSYRQIVCTRAGIDVSALNHLQQIMGSGQIICPGGDTFWWVLNLLLVVLPPLFLFFFCSSDGPVLSVFALFPACPAPRSAVRAVVRVVRQAGAHVGSLRGGGGEGYGRGAEGSEGEQQ